MHELASNLERTKVLYKLHKLLAPKPPRFIPIPTIFTPTYCDATSTVSHSEMEEASGVVKMGFVHSAYLTCYLIDLVKAFTDNY